MAVLHGLPARDGRSEVDAALDERRKGIDAQVETARADVHRQARGVPETRIGGQAPVVGRGDEGLHRDRVAALGQDKLADATDLDARRQHRRAGRELPARPGAKHDARALLAEARQRWVLEGHELGRGRARLAIEACLDINARKDSSDARDAPRGDLWLNEPELRVGVDILRNLLVDADVGAHGGQRVREADLLDDADPDIADAKLGRVRPDAGGGGEHHGDEGAAVLVVLPDDPDRDEHG